MSLLIDIDRVTGVLLADGWHDVDEESFEVDSYEMVQGRRQESVERDRIVLGGGECEGISSHGATWHGKDRHQMYCPLPNIIALRT